jgi:transglutaminase-like putative cysteine protease
MTQTLRIVHETRYDYDEPVTTSHHEIHLTPRNHRGQRCLSHEILVEPSPVTMRDRLDYFKNQTRYFGIHESHRSLRIVAQSRVELAHDPKGIGNGAAIAGRPADIDEVSRQVSWEAVRDRVARDRSRDSLDAYSFVFDSPYIKAQPGLAELARRAFAPGRPLLEAATDLTRLIFTEFTYDPQATRVSTPLSEVLELRRGVCQDFAHLEIGCLRALGLPARYMSGYLLTSPPPGKPRLVGADASHAWIATYVPPHGWIEFDPANNLVQPEKHVVVAYGRDFGDVTPVRGVVMGGGTHRLRVSVDVAPIDRPSVQPPP